jgi:glycosyltransferase involved in cell wall biosynthesis
METTKITIVFGTYKDPELIIPSIEGLLSQTLIDFKVFIIDDNNPLDTEIVNRTIQILGSYNDARFSLIKNDINVGVPFVYRKWFNLIESEYFLICGAGDVLLPDALSEMVNYLDKHPNSSFVHGLETFVSEDNSVYEITHPKRESGEYSPTEYLKFHLIGGKDNLGWSQASAVYRTEYLKYKGVEVTNNHYWDHFFHCIYLLNSSQVGFLNNYLAKRHVDTSLNVWAQQNTFTHRLERRIQTSKFIDEFEVLLIQKKYPINRYRLKNALQIIKRIGYCRKSEEFHLAARVAIGDLVSVIGIGILRIVIYPLLKLFSLIRKH